MSIEDSIRSNFHLVVRWTIIETDPTGLLNIFASIEYHLKHSYIFTRKKIEKLYGGSLDQLSYPSEKNLSINFLAR